jgi:hypothetical protein
MAAVFSFQLLPQRQLRALEFVKTVSGTRNPGLSHIIFAGGLGGVGIANCLRFGDDTGPLG